MLHILAISKIYNICMCIYSYIFFGKLVVKHLSAYHCSDPNAYQGISDPLF